MSAHGRRILPQCSSWVGVRDGSPPSVVVERFASARARVDLCACSREEERPRDGLLHHNMLLNGAYRRSNDPVRDVSLLIRCELACVGDRGV